MARYFDLPIELSPAKNGPQRRDVANSDQQRESDTEVDESLAEPSESASEEEEGPIKLPGFPHTPLKADAAFLPARQRRKRRNLKKQHFTALNTVLHKCVLEGDFTRASRALGLLLRFKIRGQYVDLRRKDLWGLAGEILLRRGGATDVQESTTEDCTFFTEKGFQDAKSFYERLILQYPYQKQRPRDISAVHFYHAMFSLWIMHLQSKYCKALYEIDRATNSPGQPQPPDSRDDPTQVKSQVCDLTLRSDEQQMQIKIEQIGEVQALEERLGGLVLQVPYDQDKSMNKLHDDVVQWLYDLRAGNERLQNNSNP